MKSNRLKFTELIIIFLMIPVSFVFSFSPIIKLTIGLFSFSYIIYILIKVEKIKFRIQKNINWNFFWLSTIIKFLFIIIATTTFVYFTDKTNLFTVVLNKPILWIVILIFYSLFSVYPQELIYRTFFFKRYQSLFKNAHIFILLNALIFSLAHLLFKNTLVIFLTFLGGLLFAITYNKTKSTLLVSIEHAIYGSWLFTVGMGNMLGFPS
ncbi:type II CAAX endopeptidase family protein [uncultured Polaribacter sp.]|uniref:CPBP family intramembrane glutamic endopeptidase n=1 Tax=uncultured Polaribacter sp. TaxID=174711 RepID=UPI002633A260|nr:type II CAAX endopeptidase family protein [uncultured Polaribacter sp.]